MLVNFMSHSMFPFLPSPQANRSRVELIFTIYLRNGLIEIHFYNGLQMLMVGCVILFLLWIAYFIPRVTYVRFNSNLNLMQ